MKSGHAVSPSQKKGAPLRSTKWRPSGLTFTGPSTAALATVAIDRMTATTVMLFFMAFAPEDRGCSTTIGLNSGRPEFARMAA